MQSFFSQLSRSLRAARSRDDDREQTRGPPLARTERAGRWLLAAALVVAPLAIGAIHTVTLAILACVAATSAFLLHWRVEGVAPRVAARTLLVVAIGLTAYTALQAIPLPAGVVRALSPEAASVWSRALAPLHEGGPSWVTLSLDPIATRIQVLRGITYLSIFLSALRVAERHDGAIFLERALVVASLAMASSAALHPAFGAERVFGAYRPVERSAYLAHRVAPLLNTNHLAAFVNIGFVIAVGAAVTRRKASLPRFVAIACAIVLLAVTVWTGSRGGAVSAVVGFAGALILTRVGRKAEGTGGLMATAVAALALGGGALFFSGMFADVFAQMGQKDLSKLALIRRAFSLMALYPVFGAGRGAFESVFASTGYAVDNWVFTHPENVVAQWVTEWGLPVTVVSMSLIAYSIGPQSVLGRSHPSVGPWAALVATLVHNQLDFNAEVPGVMICVVVCAALVVASSAGKSLPARDAWARFVPRLALATPVLAAIAIGVCLPNVQSELFREQRRFQQLATDSATSKEAFHAEIREAMLRHPADPYFPMVGALRATLARDESVVPWVARALDRNPSYGRAHLLLARSLYVRHPAQARLEYRLAYLLDAPLRWSIALEVAKLVDTFDDAMELVPPGPAAPAMLENLAGALAETRPSTSWRLDDEAIKMGARAQGPVRRRAAAAMLDVREPASWCESRRRACVSEALQLARQVRAFNPTACEGATAVAELTVEATDVRFAIDDLDRTLERAPDPAQCIRGMIEIAGRAGQDSRVDAAMARLERQGCPDPDRCYENLVFLAEAEIARGKLGHALSLYKKAVVQAPSRDEPLERIAWLASSQKLHGEALDAMSKLADRHPEEARWRDGVAAERAAIQARAFAPPEIRPPP